MNGRQIEVSAGGGQQPGCFGEAPHTLPTHWTSQGLQQHIRGLLDGFLSSDEAEEAVSCFKEAASTAGDCLDEVALCVLRTVLVRSRPQRELLGGLLQRLHREQVLSTQSLMRGFAKLACTWEELAVDDGAQALVALVGLLLGCIRAGCLEQAFLTRLPEGLLASVLRDVAREEGAVWPELQEAVCRLQEFKHGVEEASLLEPPTRCAWGAAPLADRVARTLRKLAMPQCQHEFVKRALAVSLDWTMEQRKFCLSMLRRLREQDVLSQEDLEWGAIRLLGQLEDLVLDCPESPGITSEHLQGLVAQGLLSAPFVGRCRSLRVGGAAGLAVLEAVQEQLTGSAAAAAAAAMVQQEQIHRDGIGRAPVRADPSGHHRGSAKVSERAGVDTEECMREEQGKHLGEPSLAGPQEHKEENAQGELEDAAEDAEAEEESEEKGGEDRKVEEEIDAEEEKDEVDAEEQEQWRQEGEKQEEQQVEQQEQEKQKREEQWEQEQQRRQGQQEQEGRREEAEEEDERVKNEQEMQPKNERVEEGAEEDEVEEEEVEKDNDNEAREKVGAVVQADRALAPEERAGAPKTTEGAPAEVRMAAQQNAPGSAMLTPPAAAEGGPAAQAASSSRKPLSSAGLSLRPGGSGPQVGGGSSLTGLAAMSLRPGGGGFSLRPNGGGYPSSTAGAASSTPVAKPKEAAASKPAGGQAASRGEEAGSSRNARARGSQRQRRGQQSEEADKGAWSSQKGTGPEKLAVSEDSWAARQRQRRGALEGTDEAAGVSDEEVTRRMKSILNKLTLEKFDDLFKQLINCGISTEDHIRILMTEVFEKAVTQHHFIEMYTSLCVGLSEWFSTHVKVGNFKRILLDQCQASFEANLHPPHELAMKKRKHKAPPADAATPESAEELEEKRLRYKMRVVGNIKFVGQLLVKRILASKVLIACADTLLAERTPNTLEPLANLLTVAGREFDVPSWQHRAALESIFAKVQALTRDRELPSRTRFLLQDVLDLRASSWEDRKKATKRLEGPKKLEEIASEAP